MRNGLEERMHEYIREVCDGPRATVGSRAPSSAVNCQSPLFLNPSSRRTPMQPQIPEAPAAARVRIYSHVTQSRFLHIEDSLKIGKLRLFAGNYRRGQGMAENGHANHFIDLADARVIFHALATAEQNFSHKEYKGTPPQGRSGAVSRVLSVTVKGDNVYVELKSGPGKLTATGAVMPDGKPQVEVNVGFKLYEARRLGATVLAYIQAWDVMRMLANKHAVSPPITYLLVPTAAEGNGRAPATVNGQPSVENRQSPIANGHGRPATRHGPGLPAAVPAPGNGAACPAPAPAAAVPVALPQAHAGRGKGAANPAEAGQTAASPAPPAAKPPARPDAETIAQALYGPDEAPSGAPTPAQLPDADDRLLVYGDGAAVDAENATEKKTFRRYLAEQKAAPASKSALQTYYLERKGG
jgi:hypothetical protein